MASVSLNVLSENPASLRRMHSWVMWWLELYDSIRAFFGFSIEGDLRAARVLNNALADKGWCRNLWRLCELLRSRRVCIVGGAASGEKDVGMCGLEKCGAVIAVDGAAGFVRELGIVPDIVVSDLDGSWESLLWAARLGSRLVVHGHGDNLYALKVFITMLPRDAAVYGSVQVRPPGDCVHVSGGFTDGDRALAIAVLCGAVEIVLLGMDFDAPVGPWSKPWLRKPVKPWPLKAKKLRVGKVLTQVLAGIAEAVGQRVVWCSGGRG